MKKIILSLIFLLFLCFITGCNNKTEAIKNNNTQNPNEQKESDNMSSLKVIIDNKNYILNLIDNETTKKFVELLPKEYTMKELNGNEKYIYLDYYLPTNSYNPKHINRGDVMLFGDNCLVIFYKSFNTNYSYTKIGEIEDLPDLGSSNITVRFEI